MEDNNFRKLDIDLPKQPLSNQHPWLVAGLVLVIIILLIAACTYFWHQVPVK